MKLSCSVISGVTIPLSLRWAASQTSPTAAWQTRRADASWADDVNVTSQSSSANWGGGVRITPAANNKKQEKTQEKKRVRRWCRKLFHLKCQSQRARGSKKHQPDFYFFQSWQRSENCVSARLIMIIMTFRHRQPFLLPAIVWSECDVCGPIERTRRWHGARTNHGCPHYSVRRPG